jgi:hypothetical protein
MRGKKKEEAGSSWERRSKRGERKKITDKEGRESNNGGRE